MHKNKMLCVKPAISAIALAIALSHMGGASAAQYELGDGTLEWNNIVRYNVGMRVEKQDDAIRTNASTDEGTSSYDRGDIVTNRVDFYSELGYDHQGMFGFKLSGSAWYDDAFNSEVKTGPGLESRGSYDDNSFSGFTKRYHRGLSGELLDAHVYSNFQIGDTAGDIKVGRQTNLWGEAVIFSPHSVSYSQAPVDGLKAAVAPGADAREISMPVGQVHINLQATPELSLAAQYFYEWEPTRLTEGGTYLAGTDFILEGPDKFSLAPGVDLRNRGINEPKDSGDWGVAARYFYEPFNATVGAYYREFTERAPFLSLDIAGRTYEALYPENAKLYGLSFSKLVGKTSFGAELVHRRNTALLSSITDGSDNVARGDTWHFLANGIRTFGPGQYWSTASLTAEIAGSYLEKVTKNEDYFNFCDSTGDAKRGCATRKSVQGTIRFNPQWTAVAVGWDAGFSTAFTYGLYGNSVVSGGGQEKVGSYSFGPSLTYNANHQFSLQYIDYLATKKDRPSGGILYSNGSQLQDRGWLSLTYTGQF